MRCGGRFDIEKKRARVDLIERESAQPGFWDDQKKAQSLGKEKSQLEGAIGQYEREKARVDDAVALWELAEEANDPQAREEAKVATADGKGGLESPEETRRSRGPQERRS